MKLSPCPFCGNKKPNFIIDGANFWKGVECKGCGLNIYFFTIKGKSRGINVGFHDSAKEAKERIVKCWNRRK